MASGCKKESKIVDGLLDIGNGGSGFADDYTKHGASAKNLDRAVAGDNIGISLFSNSVGGNNSSKAIEGATKANNIPGRGYHKEVYANKPVKVTEAVDKWDEFLGPGEYTDIHPRTGLKDPDRIFSADGKRSIRFGSHEMNSKPSKFHYHEEIWTYDPINNVMNVDNTVVRVPYKN